MRLVSLPYNKNKVDRENIRASYSLYVLKRNYTDKEHKIISQEF